MLITAVERRRGRVDVSADGEWRFDVSREMARERGLRTGRAITLREVEEIRALDARREALRSAASMVARRRRSEREVRQRLTMRRFEAAVVDETVAKLKAAGLIDDREFAQAWVEARDMHSPRGRRLAAAELRARGVDAPTAIEASVQISEENAAYRAAAKRAALLKDADLAEFRTKLAGLLQRRGFGWDAVRATVDRCWRERAGSNADADPAFDDLAHTIE